MTLQKFFNQKGTSLIEIIIVMSIFSTLITVTTLSLLNVRSKTSVNTGLYSFISDFKNQQIKAMVGDTEGRGTPDVYSVYIAPTSYTLYHGANYFPGDSGNFTINAPDGYALSTTFPFQKITFATGSGELSNFVQGNDTVTFTETSSGIQKVIKINSFGAIVSIN